MNSRQQNKNQKEVNYQKMDLIKKQIISNGDEIKAKEILNKELAIEYKKLENENQDLAENIDYYSV